MTRRPTEMPDAQSDARFMNGFPVRGAAKQMRDGRSPFLTCPQCGFRVSGLLGHHLDCAVRKTSLIPMKDKP